MPYLDETGLDDPDELARRDSRATLRALATAGAQVREAVTLSTEAGVDRVAYGERPRSVVVAALGGSAVVADVLEMLAEPSSPVPVTVRRNLPLPGWVGPLDLVIAVSLSGRADGPVAVAREAARRGAALLTVGAEDSPLAEISHRARGVHIGVGRGRASSRTSLWSLLTPVLMAGHVLGLVDVPESVLPEVATRLDEQAEACRPSSESFVNPAKLIAVQLAETVPVVLGDGALAGVAARRAAAMLAQTARMPATWGELPDAASQVVACFDGPFTAGGGTGAATARQADIFADPFLDAPAQPKLGLMMLRDAPLQPKTQESDVAAALTDAVLGTARSAGAKVIESVAAPGHSVVRLAELMALTDFAATYLALGFGLDPAVSPHVADLRDRTSDQ
ncbi:bifunctional glucose-6-phosphate/mannose-6-phosphate isomerase [Flexivirga endophytica]|uniref:Bifunctional glucose-6-phosphate/mannose-6-phosphate isomerase n=1 Tax=Flexivirga endophytica TaxID=1849103 RepID=A0A916TDC0_9MICO|nr:SIS domain-containing protein [Flexivirga endophytica]GGB39049.1 bifunctional glucose-6-phosphate/mannose-6-phosphate isomerase [Flexivirga endophytica]GHB47024.1 bifunctional glucose-6-phosphate/mannose-6-phosphate isomerase [Flexivirga endophytica]